MTMNRQLLMLPGPTPLPARVMQAMAAPLMNHRSQDWSELYWEIEKGAKWAHQTQHDILMVAGAGTYGMEAAIANTLSPGDKVLALSMGYFGTRFGTIAERYGMEVDRLTYAQGQVVNLADVAAKLEADTARQIKAVLVTHNETSTGTLNDLKGIADLVHAHGALILVDGISSVLTAPCPTDDWHIDILISASQKSYMAPPGLAFVSVSPKAWEAYAQSKLPRYALDFEILKDFANRGHNPWTPSMPVYYALKESMQMLQAEGYAQVIARHEHMMRAVRAGAQALGFRPLVQDEANASRCVTTLYPPEGMDAEAIRMHLLNTYNVMIAGGQGDLMGKIVRIGHLGYQSMAEIYGTLSCLEKTVQELGHVITPGAAVAAALAL
jgi:aspartate aminotransferase-like enzyme